MNWIKSNERKRIWNSLNEAEQFDFVREKLQREYKASLYLTAKKLLGYSDINARTHGEMIDALEDESARCKLIAMPRGTFKSSVSSVAYPIWLLMNDPNKRIFLTSEVYTNSKNLLREIKGKLRTEYFLDVFGSWEGDGAWTEGELVVGHRTIEHKEASITCGGVETVKVGQHYEVIIADDLNSNNNSSTPEGLRKVSDYFKMLTGILEPGGIIVLVGTRYSSGDTLGEVLRNETTDEQKAWLKSMGVI